MHGGTSRALCFHAGEPPADPASGERLLPALTGSPGMRQVDVLAGVSPAGLDNEHRGGQSTACIDVATKSSNWTVKRPALPGTARELTEGTAFAPSPPRAPA